MHILIIPSEHLVTESAPLAGVFQYEQAKALAKSENTVGIISVGCITLRYLFKGYSYQKSELFDNLKIVRDYRRIFFPNRYYSFDFLKKKYIKIFLNCFEKYVEDHGMPDIVHAHNFLYAGVIAEELKAKFKLPYIVTEHSSAFAKGIISKEIDSDLRKISSNSSFCTCVSTPFKRILQDRLNVNFDVLHNIVDSSFFEAPLNTFKANKMTFINVASLDDNKNQELLIRAFSKEFKDKEVYLKIVGEGVLDIQLSSLSKKIGVDSQIEFLGRLPRSKVREQMLSSHCFVLSSNYETFGVVLIEALACGLPLIATKCGGPEDIVNSSNGLLVAIKNQQQLQDAMQSMLTKYHENSLQNYDPRALRNEALVKFGEKAFVEKVMYYYQKAIDKNNTEN